MGYCIDHLPSRLSIGRETENGVTDIRIDCTDWLERWPGMVVAAIFCPPGGTPYIVNTEMSGNSLVWHVRDTDTATPGIGQLELTGEADGKRKLSALVDVQVARRLPGTAGDAPDPAQPWVDSVLGAAERITGMQVAAKTLEAGSAATAQWNGEAGLLTLGIPMGIVGPQGEKGDTGGVGPAGSDGITPAISVGTVTTLEAGSQATVARRGTDAAPIFDFGIPRGRDGEGGGASTWDDLGQGQNDIEKLLLDNATVTLADMNGIALAQTATDMEMFDPNYKYKIVFNGIEYILQADFVEGFPFPFVGNPGVAQAGEDNGIPFFIAVIDDGVWIVSAYVTYVGDNIISIYRYEKEILPVPEKYMPAKALERACYKSESQSFYGALKTQNLFMAHTYFNFFQDFKIDDEYESALVQGTIRIAKDGSPIQFNYTFTYDDVFPFDKVRKSIILPRMSGYNAYPEEIFSNDGRLYPGKLSVYTNNNYDTVAIDVDLTITQITQVDDIYIPSTIQRAGGTIILTDENGAKWRLTVGTDGTLTTEAVTE